MAPLRQAFVAARAVPDDGLRTIILLTDGEVNNTAEVVKYAAENAHRCRIFAVGIGNTVSHHLVDGISNVTGGSFVCLRCRRHYH